MSEQRLEISVPGKLFIAGEYAVLEPGHPAMVIAVNRYMKGDIRPNREYHLSLPGLGLDSLYWTYEDGEVVFAKTSKRLSFIKNTLEVCLQYLSERQIPLAPFSLRITSELDDASGKKYGLGSSAATAVTVVTSILHFFHQRDVQVSRELIFKLASIAHFKTQGNGSCADIAASTYGGWIQYSIFDQRWLIREIASKKPLKEILSRKWPGLEITKITPPDSLHLCVGWTGEKASTASMVGRIQHLKQDHRESYEQFLADSKASVQKILAGFQENDMNKVFQGIRSNRAALKKLGDLTGVPIETEELRNLIETANRYGVGKTSGAGGGDCGIAFVTDESDIERLKATWRNQDIYPLELSVSPEGATVKTVD